MRQEWLVYFKWRPLEFFIISLTVFLRLRIISDIKEIKTHILCSITFLKSHAIYEIMWKNIVEWSRPQMTIQSMHREFWIPKDTDTHSPYIILNAFLLQQWLHYRALMLCYTHIACLVILCIYLSIYLCTFVKCWLI